MTAPTLVTETATCRHCGEQIKRRPEAPAWQGGRDWHDPAVLDQDNDGTRCDGSGAEHEPEPPVQCPQCEGACEIGDEHRVVECSVCDGQGEISAERAVELDNSGWCTNTGRGGYYCGYLAACPECRGE